MGAALRASALGFGPAPVGAVLGQPLDHLIPLRLEADETLAAECVAAEVTIGDQRLPPSAVSTRLESDNGRIGLRVVTSSIVEEPVVSVSVGIGCPLRLSRRFVLFADPPSPGAPSAPVPMESQPPLAQAERVVAAAEARGPAAAPEVRASAAPTPVRPAVTSEPPPRRAAPVRRAQRAADGGTPSAAAAGRPRLKLDAVDPAELRQARVEAADVAASAAAAVAEAQANAQASAQSASESARRVAELERAIEKMRTEALADREALRGLRQQAASADGGAAWMPYLVALVAALMLLTGWLAWRLRQLQSLRQAEWWNAAAGAAAGEGPPVAPTVAPSPADTMTLSTNSGGPVTTRPGALTSGFRPSTGVAARAGAAGELPQTAVERTQALPVGWRDEAEAPRDVSIEELIDLEQQAEFFSVLGQEEAAIDLLVDYLRSTGGGSPMPYLKLLEIYRRRDDRESYDRTRARFNHRFNAYAPDWEADPTQGRSLEDYPAIVARLQMAWASPINAMAELESLLFRKSRGELFDLPAYRDVLFLYSLARDLLDREPLETGTVDVLLPISDGSEFTQPMSFEDSPAGLSSGLVPLDNAPTVPVDLDVTQPATPESLFGEGATLPGIPGGGPRRY